MADYHNYQGLKVETSGDWTNEYKNYVEPGSLKEVITPDYKPSKPKKVQGNSKKKDDKLEQAIANDLATRGIQQTHLNEQ
jgi:ribosomal protein S18